MDRSINDAAKHFGVCPSTVVNACRSYEANVKNRSFKGVQVNSFAIVKSLLEGKTEVEVAEEFGISHQRVNQLRMQAVAGGWTELQKKNR